MATQLAWSFPPSLLTLKDGELHVWRASLPHEAGPQRQFEKILAQDEKERAGKFLVTDAREDFVATRGILRELLGRYLGKRPADVSFRSEEYGKPVLSGLHDEKELHFNVSHSHGYAVFAFAEGSEVGIDVEKVRPEVSGDDIARRFFSDREVSELLSVSHNRRAKSFFECWTRKEAYIKARGQGLQIPLRSFDVSVLTDAPQWLVADDDSSWSLHSFEPAVGFVGAVAVRGREWELRYFDWRQEAEVSGG